MLLRVLQGTANGIQSVFFALQDVTLCRRRPDQGDGEAEKSCEARLAVWFAGRFRCFGVLALLSQAPREFESS